MEDNNKKMNGTKEVSPKTAKPEQGTTAQTGKHAATPSDKQSVKNEKMSKEAGSSSAHSSKKETE